MNAAASSALIVFASALLASTGSAGAQVRASEESSVSQTVDGTVFTVNYSRPRLRGRTDVFGKLITWNEVWTPGANRATLLRASRPFTINGHAMPSGAYSVWLQPKESGPWTLMLHPDTTRMHFMHPKIDSGKLAFDVTPQRTASTTEVLTWSFPSVTADGATLDMAWEGVHVPLELKVTPSVKRTTPAADAEAYTGTYDVEWYWNPDKPTRAPMTIRYNAADSTLRAESVVGREPWNLILAPISTDVFTPLFLLEGSIGDAAETMTIEFIREQGRITGFDVRDKETDKRDAHAVRKK